MSDRLAVDGGKPVRETLLPYGRQSVDGDDLKAITEVLTSDFLTTGPRVQEFEEAFAERVGAAHAVAVANGTAALHAAMHTLQIRPGDEVIVPPITFAATANAVVYLGGTPVFADVEAATLLLDPEAAMAKVTSRTRAILAVDYAGQPCDYPVLKDMARRSGIALVADACHALGARDADGGTVGSLADLSTFSFHPVKPITTAEGGMVTTDDPDHAARMHRFRNHGISADYRQREAAGDFYYEMVELGYNYRLSDLHCALGRSQLERLNRFVARRREIARTYDRALAEVPAAERLAVRPGVGHAYHLYPIKLQLERLRVDRATVFRALRAEGIGVNVHYIPVHLHPFYRQRLRTGPGLCPIAEDAYSRLLTLPLFPGMTDADAGDVVGALEKVLSAYVV